MRDDLKLLVDAGHQGLARNMFMQERLRAVAEAAKLDPDDWDLNPHLQLVAIAERVVSEMVAEGFPEASKEEVYRLWLTGHVFGHNPIPPRRPGMPRPRPTVRTNEHITAAFVEVILPNGSKLGPVPVGEALKLAREAGLDLVEINPRAGVPVCKILDFAKY